MKTQILVLSLLAVAFSGHAQEQKVYGDYKHLRIEDDVKWIDETPNKPEEYIGQIFTRNAKTGDLVPYFTPVRIPVDVDETPASKKSILIKASKDGSISFLEFFKIGGQTESVYQFQIVHNKKWSASTRSNEYLKAIGSFRNDPVTSPIFDSADIDGVLMVTAVVEKRIWYKAYKSKSGGGSGNYLVRIDGNEYFSSEDSEEIKKYGLLLRPLKGWGISIPRFTSINPVQINSTNANIPKEVLNKLDTKMLMQLQ